MANKITVTMTKKQAMLIYQHLTAVADAGDEEFSDEDREILEQVISKLNNQLF